MSITTSIYIQSAEGIEELSRGLEEILRVQFRWHEGPRTLLIFVDPSAHIEGHLEINQDTIDDFTAFEFQYNLSVHSKSNIPRTRGQSQIDYAREVFNKLKDVGKYPLLLLHNAEEILDEYLPD